MPWEMDDKKMSGVKWILHRGLSIGKKMLVAGIVISSAPVIIPPLIVVSALGFAVSLPYGMILASYTCSEKLLNKLLPETCYRHSPKEDDYASAYEEVKDLSIPSGEPNEEAVKRIEGVFLTAEAEASEHDHDKSGIVAATVETKDSVDLVPTNNKMSDHGEMGEMKTVTEQRSNGRKGKKKGWKKEEIDEKMLPKVSDDRNVDKIKTSEKVAVHSLPGETASKIAMKEVLPISDHFHRKAKVDQCKSMLQGVYTEEGIWQMIDAIRQIVGYKAVRRASCMEELKALYLFTGVEPPASFKDTSDLSEVYEKLRFLFSVVGVE